MINQKTKTKEGELYTIGHSTYELSIFMGMLKAFDIDHLLDIRSVPYSKFAWHYNQERLCESLNRRGIRYSCMGKYFGARLQDPSLYHKDGYLDFEKVRKSSLFLRGLDNVMLGLNQGHRIALMCSEKDPLLCHRMIMVARAFELHGVQAKHILHGRSSLNCSASKRHSKTSAVPLSYAAGNNPLGCYITQQEANQILLEAYFPAQLSFFTYLNEMSWDERLEEAYRRRNEEIGFRPEPGKIIPQPEPEMELG